MAGVIDLYQWEISPYCEKIRKILDYKELSYRTLEQPLLRRDLLQKKTGQQKVPVLCDNGRWVADSTDIALYLEERYPARPILPPAGRERQLCLLLEDWSDEAFASAVQPVKWLTPGNSAALLSEMGKSLPGLANRVLLRAASPVLRRTMQALSHGRGAKRTRHLLGYQLDLLESLLAGQPYLFGETPTLADFSAASLVKHLTGLAGYEEVTRRRSFSAMIARIDAIASRRVRVP